MRINWSKIPWARLRKMDAAQLSHFFTGVQADLRAFARRVREVGFTAVSLDDLGHLAYHEFYEQEVLDRIVLYRAEFRKLFAILREEGLEIYLTTDVISLTPALARRLRGSPWLLRSHERKTNAFFKRLIDRFFGDFPQVSGLILRIGESDGQDVKDEFRSELYLKDPAKVNRFLKRMLPVFEKHGRTCLFRTWTVGAHRVGDLIWHHSTLEQTIRGIDSPALVLSMKHGESDFFRYLDLNRNFFVSHLPKIVELQTRREYEGCGEYPSFVGWDYERCARELAHAPNVIGISVWCQTGGWTPFRRLAYLEPAAVWTEINTFVTLKVFKEGSSVEEAIAAYPGCDRNRGAWIELLRLSDEVIKELLYVGEFASQPLYFRRVRIPPLIGIYWYTIFISHPIKKLLSHFVDDPERCVRTGHAALEKIGRMKTLAGECGLPVADIEYMEATFGILALGREYLMRPFDESVAEKLKRAKKEYKKKYPRGTRFRYAVKLDFKPFRMKSWHIRWLFKHLVRDDCRYRLVDRVLTVRLISVGWWILKRARPRMIPKFARKSAMGIDAVFK